jgi:hypothetical protein
MSNFFLYASFILIAFSLVAGVVSWAHLDSILKIVFILALTGAVAEAIGVIYGKFHQNNTVIFNGYVFVNLLLLGLLAIKSHKGKIYRAFVFCGILICAIIDVGCIWRMGVNVFANWAYLAEGILATVVFLFVFIDMFISGRSNKIIMQPMLWVCGGLLLYHGCTVPLFGFLNYLIKYQPTIASKVYNINAILNGTKYVFFGIAFLLARHHVNTAKTITA